MVGKDLVKDDVQVLKLGRRGEKVVEGLRDRQVDLPAHPLGSKVVCAVLTPQQEVVVDDLPHQSKDAVYCCQAA